MNGDNFEETYKIYSREAYGSDQWLYGQGAHSKEIMRLLADGQSYSVLGCADKEDTYKTI